MIGCRFSLIRTCKVLGFGEGCAQMIVLDTSITNRRQKLLSLMVFTGAPAGRWGYCRKAVDKLRPIEAWCKVQSQVAKTLGATFVQECSTSCTLIYDQASCTGAKKSEDSQFVLLKHPSSCILQSRRRLGESVELVAGYPCSAGSRQNLTSAL